MVEKVGRRVIWLVLAAVVVAVVLGSVLDPWWWMALVLLVPLAVLGIWDVTQRRHSILRNFPILGHSRYFLEGIGAELHQYLVESNTDGRPFDRDTRSLIYERAKHRPDVKAFGTELDVYEEGYTWLAHSIAPRPVPEDPVGRLRVVVGGERCTQPYSLSVLNISAMSFGSLGANAVLAMNQGAREGRFAQDTGEGGISRYHREHGGDLIWEIGTGYFGCRTADGRFDPDRFAAQAVESQVKMIEIKVSQGAKPGHGGLLPAAKVSQEIAEARGVPVGRDVLSPMSHSAFATPIEMMSFITQLRDLSGGKPVGFKLCVGDPHEFASITKAMIETGTYPDFIVVDGGEGGTGAAPLEFSDSLGMPLIEGLMLVQNVLRGAGVRDRMKVGASGKLVTASAMAQAMALGADWCNTARAFMMSVGCIQAQICHTNRCPVGVTTQNPRLQRALVVDDKAVRARQFHDSTVRALAELVSAMGLDHPGELRPDHVVRRVSQYEVRTFAEIHPPLQDGSLLAGTAPERFQLMWDCADTDAFGPERG